MTLLIQIHSKTPFRATCRDGFFTNAHITLLRCLSSSSRPLRPRQRPSAGGHVFHALCLEQWQEYCLGGKKLTCPICKQPCGAAYSPTCLFFQSTGVCPTQACPSSQQGANGGVDRDELAAEVARLEQKSASLSRVLEEQRDGIQKLNAEASSASPVYRISCWAARWREQVTKAEAMRKINSAKG
ncbi:hypothetical protein GUJ93_ZPchr0002g24088 [Zizania palustris]|uniref:RING-type domain-containing protein n=1 Tax=Zizania palustris TaxID=103762 RepID=A0A8J5VBY6_ZIZPA|nr:hypothetical protein GUJ93_ZPchr0002g24088 [Zizania palustris]